MWTTFNPKCVKYYSKLLPRCSCTAAQCAWECSAFKICISYLRKWRNGFFCLVNPTTQLTLKQKREFELQTADLLMRDCACSEKIWEGVQREKNIFWIITKQTDTMDFPRKFLTWIQACLSAVSSWNSMDIYILNRRQQAKEGHVITLPKQDSTQRFLHVAKNSE